MTFALLVGVSALALAVVAAVSDPAPGALAPVPVLAGDQHAVAYGPLPEQLLDVQHPADASGPVPAIVFVHSGGWVAGTRLAVPDVIADLRTDLGLAIVPIDYRLVGTAPDGTYTNTFPAPMWDVDRAIRFVRAHAVEWGLDPERIVVAGASAGGHLAALAGAAPGRFVDPALPPEMASVSPEVLGVIDYVGPSDFRSFWRAGGWAPAMTAALLGCAPEQPETCDPARVDDATVLTHLVGRPPPAFFAYGERDALVIPATQGAPLAQAWAAARGEPSVTPQQGGVWYQQRVDADHNFTPALDGGLVAQWLSEVLDGALR
jgi:acetyl esterase/lipase